MTAEAQATTRPPTAKPSLPPWRAILTVIRFRPWLCLLDLFAALVFRFAWQIAPGLILQAFFDMLAGQAGAGMSVWSIAA